MPKQPDDKQARFTDQQLHMTARLYYTDGLAQGDVARLMRVSQPQVSRMLAEARQRGIVVIHVKEYDPRDRAIEKALIAQLGLKQAVVVKVTAGVSPGDVRTTVGHFAGPFITSMISKSRTLAIAGGRTLGEVIRFAKEPDARMDLTVLQAMGQVGVTPDKSDAQELGRLLCATVGGSCRLLNAPAFLPDATTRNTVAGLEQIDEVLKQLRKADTALVGVGTAYNSVFAERQVLSDTDMARLEKANVVGEICGRYFDASGGECDATLRDRVISVRLEELRGIRNVVAVVSGADRVAAVRAAINGGIVKSVIVDDGLGAALLAQDNLTTQQSDGKGTR
jgi:deoxyribonucleoside regulator